MTFSARPQTRPRTATLQDLAAAAGGAVIGDGETPVLGLEFDSRLVRDGDMFVALRGGDFDGHTYINHALQAGASAVLVERAPDAPVPGIVVEDSRAGLAMISDSFFGQPSHELRVVGITGTDGKTTTSHLVESLLNRSGQQTGVIGTTGIRIGPDREYRLAHQTTPESSLIQGFLREMVEQTVDTAVIEATSHGLALYRLDGVAFDIAAVTNITHEHLEYHGTIENYRRAKAILVERTSANGGVVVLNADDEGAMSMRSSATGARRVVTFSASGAEAGFRAVNVQLAGDGTRFELVHPDGQIAVASPMIGEFNVANALCAIGVAANAGMSVGDAVCALRLFPGVPGRLQTVDSGQPFGVTVDYAHTPESLRSILGLLRRIGGGGRLIVVTGSGGERDRAKRPMQGDVCVRGADVSIFTNEDPRHEPAEAIIAEIAEGARQAGAVEGAAFHQVVDRRDAIALAFRLAAPGDSVLLAGKGHEQSIIVGHQHSPWDEPEVARELLGELGYSVDAEVKA